MYPTFENKIDIIFLLYWRSQRLRDYSRFNKIASFFPSFHRLVPIGCTKFTQVVLYLAFSTNWRYSSSSASNRDYVTSYHSIISFYRLRFSSFLTRGERKNFFLENSERRLSRCCHRSCLHNIE